MKNNMDNRGMILLGTKAFWKFFNISMDGLWITDSEGHFIEVNPAYCQMTGYSREEILTMSIADVEDRETPVMVSQHIKEIIDSGRARFESIHRRKDGSVIEVEVNAAFLDVEGERLFLVFIR